MKSGIYKIVNINNNKFYIGSSKNLDKRWYIHKNKLKNNNHINCILQRSWNKHGEKSFKFDILELCDNEKLFEREQFYLDELKPEYNIGAKSTGGDNLTKNPKREDIIKKMSIANKKKYDILTDEEKRKYSEKYMGEKNPNFGNKWNDDMRKNMSLIMKEYFKNHDHYKTGKKHDEIFGDDKAKEISKKISEYASTRTGDKNSFFGKEHTDETKQKLRNNRMGKYFGEQNIPFIVDNKEYNSLGEASKDLNIPTTTIRWRIRSKNEKFSEYKYK